MELYSSPYLKINKDKNLLIQEWTGEQLTPEKFQEELQSFLQIALAEKPKGTLWLHENFHLDIPPKLYGWLENEITQKVYESGMRKIAYTVSPDVKSHISVINSFGHVQSVVNPMFYMEKNEALSYLNSEEEVKNLLSPPLDYVTRLEEERDTASVKIKMHINDLPKVLSALETIEFEKEVLASQYSNFENLTLREKEVMRCISLGYTNQQIADQLFISLHTVKNHRKRIIAKLEISSALEFHLYARAFRLIHF